MTSEYYFIDGKHQNDIYEPKYDEYKCCDKPFPVYNEKTKINNCNNCKKYYKRSDLIVYTCDDCKNIDVPLTKQFNLTSDNKTGLTKCKDCGKPVESRNITNFEIVVPTETSIKFLIIGKSMCGKSVLASKIGKQTGLPIYEDNDSNQPKFDENITKGIIMSQTFPTTLPPTKMSGGHDYDDISSDIIVLHYTGPEYVFECRNHVSESMKTMLVGFGVHV